MLHHLSPRIFHHRILMLWVMRHLFHSLMAQPRNHLSNASCDLKVRDFVLAKVTSESDFMTEYVVYGEAALQNAVAEQFKPSSKPSCKNRGIIRGIQP
ncbi:hypothetical protein RHGRI_038479 [Rhododendron griersonianum]|uniref:Uncharacterized protein n=1 Tax=Rhododendron griersonianum TaxID=479676 RepID=A0AAV6HJH0_9ERIC|nr:hypothetical protein RHGRI_038479 [Rhododendron griersonianum]